MSKYTKNYKRLFFQQKSKMFRICQPPLEIKYTIKNNIVQWSGPPGTLKYRFHDKNKQIEKKMKMHKIPEGGGANKPERSCYPGLAPAPPGSRFLLFFIKFDCCLIDFMFFEQALDRNLLFLFYPFRSFTGVTWWHKFLVRLAFVNVAI